MLKTGISRLLTMSLIALACLGSLAYYLTPGREIVVHNDHLVVENAEQLEGIADLIIVGQAQGNIVDYEPTVVSNDAGRISDFYTVFDVKALRVIKGQTAGGTVPVLQGAALMPVPLKASPDLLIREDTTLMEKGHKYLLFLKETDLPGVYSIISLNQGKFNLDSLDQKELKMEGEDIQFRNLKKDVLTRFGNKLGI